MVESKIYILSISLYIWTEEKIHPCFLSYEDRKWGHSSTDLLGIALALVALIIWDLQSDVYSLAVFLAACQAISFVFLSHYCRAAGKFSILTNGILIKIISANYYVCASFWWSFLFHPYCILWSNIIIEQSWFDIGCATDVLQ